MFPTSIPTSTYANQNPFLCFGLPFLSVLVLGSLVLSGFTQTKIDYNTRKSKK
ncbi:hypothetical protein HMI56_004775, partial [Coelomomyces lativittatus]